MIGALLPRRSDMSSVRTRWERAVKVAVLLVCVAVAYGIAGRLSRYGLSVGATLLGYIGVAQAWNLLAGFNGQVSLGVSAFVGTGAYGAGLIMLHARAPWQLALLAGTAAGGALAVLLAPALLRLRGDYFSIGSLAAALALQAWTLNWAYAGGSSGLSLPVANVPDLAGTYRLAVVVAGISLIIIFAIQNSPVGFRFIAVRDAETAASLVGVNATRQRFLALVTSSLLMSLAGGLFALQQLSFEPNGMFGIGWTLNAILMVIVGGTGTFLGPVIGAIVVYYGIATELASYHTISLFVEGGLLLAIVRLAPSGLWPLAVNTASRLLASSGFGKGKPGAPAGPPVADAGAGPTEAVRAAASSAPSPEDRAG